MRNQSGFSLFELLVYCALMALILMLLMQWIVGVVDASNKTAACCEEYITLATAMNRIRDDLIQARSIPQHVHIDQHDWYVWSLGSSDVGWWCSGNHLMRIEGEFDAVSLRWRSKVSNLVAIAKHFVMNICTQKNKPSYCHYSLEGKKVTMQKLIALRAC